MEKSEIKRRKKAAKAKDASASSKSKKNKSSDDKKKNDDAPEGEVEEVEEKTVAQEFFEHPLVVVTPFFAIPYLLYLAYYFFRLQRPDLLEPMGIHLRPAVAISDPRQVLIIGSMSSGTMQVESDLSTLLGLEIGHESSNSQSEFVRDGTVSWIHVMRYLTPPTSEVDQVRAITNLCESFTPQMGFHPAMYRPPVNKCSIRQTWSKCWAYECALIIQQEWGCALPSSPQKCQTPFRKVLHQVRHPVKTIESLTVKFCEGTLEDGTVSTSFLKFAKALFPSHDFSQDSCIEAASYYVLAYNQAMMAAQSDFLVDDAFQVETTSPCDLAKLAGFLDPEQVVYPPHAPRIAQICDGKEENSNSQLAKSVMTSRKHKINVGLVSLTWEDFHGGKYGSVRPEGDTTLEQQVRDLVQKLGYDQEN